MNAGKRQNTIFKIYLYTVTIRVIFENFPNVITHDDTALQLHIVEKKE